MTSVFLLFASLWTSFLNPPDSAKPWCYYWWINGHVDEKTITADLESMRGLGFGGILLFDSRGYWDDDDEHVINPKAELVWGSSRWYDLVEHTLRECARLKLEFTMNASASGGELNGFTNGVKYVTDISDRKEVVAHLDRVVGPLLKRCPELVGTTFTHVYSVSYEGKVRKGATWDIIKDAFYGTMRDWAHAKGLKVYSESGGPWCHDAVEALMNTDQLAMLSFNDFPQGEFWPLEENAFSPLSRHANANARFFMRGPVLAARRAGLPIVSIEAFTHMQHHWSVDPAFLKPLADQAFADGINRIVWHTFTASPEKFGVPGAEYFAGSHINRNVTWQREAAPFVRYLARCSHLLRQGDYVDDGSFRNVSTNYYDWGRYRRNPKAQFTTIHRRTTEGDLFFVAGEGKGDFVFPASGPAEIWDAVAGVRSPIKGEAVAGGTRVKLDLPIGGSCFVVFGAKNRPRDDGASAAECKYTTRIEITGPWQLSFAYHPGIAARPPQPVALDGLVDFTTREDLKHFSGTATYRTSFKIDTLVGKARLSLGKVPSGLAHVSVNGVDCGTVWCEPWTCDVSKAICQGRNELKIDYINNWYNRLVGDCMLPEAERVTRSTIHYWTKSRTGDPKNLWSIRPTIYSGYSVSDPLQPSGLLGPLELSMAEFHPCTVRGRTQPNAWVVANSGQIARADENGRYEITLPAQGVYCLKAMADGFDEATRPWLEVPAKGDVDLPLWALPNPARRVVHGNLGHPAQLKVYDSGKPIRGFDLAGIDVGSHKAPKGVWHHRNEFFWTLGEYCFTATGEVKIVESTDFPELRKRGWYKGDFHAHVIHGENFYHANLQQMNLVCRAEKFDWIYLSGHHANDGFPVDNVKLAEYLSDGHLFLRVNNEFPKNIYGHFGNLNVPPLTTRDYGPDYDIDKVTDLELSERLIYSRGGLAIPVHPLYGDVVRIDKKTGRKTYGMINNELLLWLLCRPELVPVVDFFYFPEDRAEQFWYRLLNRGYTLGCSASSDAAFDVGRTPGSSQGTFAKLDRVDGPSIVEAFKSGRTMVSYFGNAVLMEVDGQPSGSKFMPSKQKRRMTVDAYAAPGGKFLLRVVRNGKTFAERTFVAPDDGRFSFDADIVEEDNAWYVATLRQLFDKRPSVIRSAASPIYFRGPDFKPPEVIPMPRPLPANIKERLLYLTPPETDTDAWYDELKRLLTLPYSR